MKNWSERIQSFLVVIISFLLMVWPAYLQYNDLIEIDFLSPDPAFENLDPDNLLADNHDKTKTFVPTISPAISFLGFFCIGTLPCHSFQIYFPDQPISVLRCWEILLLVSPLNNKFFLTTIPDLCKEDISMFRIGSQELTKLHGSSYFPWKYFD